MRARVLFSKSYPYTHADLSDEERQARADSVKGASIRLGVAVVAKVTSARVRHSTQGPYMELEIEPVDEIQISRSPGIGSGFKLLNDHLR